MGLGLGFLGFGLGLGFLGLGFWFIGLGFLGLGLGFFGYLGFGFVFGFLGLGFGWIVLFSGVGLELMGFVRMRSSLRSIKRSISLSEDSFDPCNFLELCVSLILSLNVIEVDFKVLSMSLVILNSWHFNKSSIVWSSIQESMLFENIFGAMKLETSSRCFGSNNVELNSWSSFLTLLGKSSRSFV